jgi:hypothetical protein
VLKTANPTAALNGAGPHLDEDRLVRYVNLKLAALGQPTFVTL